MQDDQEQRRNDDERQAPKATFLGPPRIRYCGLMIILVFALIQGAASAPDTACVAPRIFEVLGLADQSAAFARAAETAGAIRADARSNTRRLSNERFKRVCGPAFMTASAAADTTAVTAVARVSAILPAAQLVANSVFAIDRNNGVLWGGKGINLQLTGGVEFRSRYISAALRPVAVYQTNGDFPIMPPKDSVRSRFAYAAHTNIDWPQRFGEEAFAVLDPGQSYLRVDAFGVAAGVSTENLWWGPGVENAIIMSNTAPGFPHFFLGSTQPFNIGIGQLQVEGVWGRLRESDYLDSDPGNDDQIFAGASITWEPKWFSGLFLGLNRAFVYPVPDSVTFGDVIAPFFQTPVKAQLATPDNPAAFKSDDQLASITARWLLPGSGFEVYAEYAKEDHNWDRWDFLNELEHSQAYSLGFAKILRRSSGWFRLRGELTHLERVHNSDLGRGAGTYYTHANVIQGYTHRGQLLGAWIGPGSNSQLLGFDLYRSWGNTGGFIQRIIHDNDAYYRDLARSYHFGGHDAELVLGSVGSLTKAKLLIDWRAAYSVRRNRNFIELGTCCEWDFKVDHNLNVQLGVTPLRARQAAGR